MTADAKIEKLKDYFRAHTNENTAFTVKIFKSYCSHHSIFQYTVEHSPPLYLSTFSIILNFLQNSLNTQKLFFQILLTAQAKNRRCISLSD